MLRTIPSSEQTDRWFSSAANLPRFFRVLFHYIFCTSLPWFRFAFSWHTADFEVLFTTICPNRELEIKENSLMTEDLQVTKVTSK